MENKINISIAIIVVFQIFLMLNYVTANSYIISQTNHVIENLQEQRKDDQNLDLFNYGIHLLIGFLSIKQIGTVSAQGVLGCCTQTTDGAVCQEVLQGDSSCSDDNFIPSRCNEVSECRTGCCIDESEGLCSENTPKGTCEAEGGEFNSDTACNILQCQLGCCVLGSQTQFVTDQRCQVLSDFHGLEKDYRQQIKTEVECLLLGNEQVFGACITSDNVCQFTTQVECLALGGDFFEGQMCSLVSSCEKQSNVGCVDEKDEIYWFDSCGNRENIYEGGSQEARDRSYNNGLVLSKADSCNPTSNNINSETCGNCNYLLGSKCSETDLSEIRVEDGPYVCRDLNCENTFDGSDRVNGESWCNYDASVGNGEDPVGSRHWRHICIDGKEIVDPCADFRQEVCVEQEINLTESGSEKFSTSSCVLNEWRTCLTINNEENVNTLRSECSENKHCFVKEVFHPGDRVADGPVTVCLPQYSPGFQFYGEAGDVASAACAFATQEVQVVQVHECGFLGIGDDWVYVANEVATTEAWTQSMNKWCTSIGDCGAYVNIAGEVTTGGYSTTGIAPSLSQSYLDGLAQFSIPNPDARAELSGTDFGGPDGEGEGFLGGAGGFGGIIGAGGLALAIIMGAGAIEGFLFGTTAAASLIEIGGVTFAVGPGGLLVPVEGASAAASGGILPPGFAPLAAAAIAFTAGVLIAQLLGLPAEQGLQLGIVGAVVAVSVGFEFGSGGLSGFAFGPALIWAIIVIIIIAIILKLIGCGEKREDPAGFQCRAWEPPSGGEDCNLCNGNDLRPCTEYRCKSLGAACEFVDADTSSPKCIWQDPNDVAPPVITPQQKGLDEGYEYDNEESCPVNCAHTLTNTQSESGCIPSFTPVTISIKTDEHARCNFDFENKAYEEMDFVLSGLFTENHTTQVSSPGVLTMLQELQNIIDNYEGTDDEDFFEDLLNRTIDDELNIFIKCMDPNGNINTAPMTINMCLDPEPDLTAPGILSINPKNGGSIKFGIEEQQIQLYTNEPANCRYSTIDQDYSTMEESFVCLNGLNQGSLQGWLCTETISELEDVNTFYIRCQDKPSFPEEERNVNTESFNYTFYKTLNELEIESISPNGTLSFGFEPISIELKVKTSKGANEGVSTCSYSFGDPNIGEENFIEFFNTGTNEHSQVFNTLTRGTYNIYVRCEDEAGNIANRETRFTLGIDTSPPRAVRVFHEGDRLQLITNELAECYYALNTCNFNEDSENAVSMTTALSTEHSADWQQGNTYHIRCIDVWGNEPNGCTIRATPNL
ncbi:MAG: hypothetical protein ACE5ES_01625, partial [Candidatus Nanoarchaeia archaeon]